MTTLFTFKDKQQETLDGGDISSLNRHWHPCMPPQISTFIFLNVYILKLFGNITKVIGSLQCSHGPLKLDVSVVWVKCNDKAQKGKGHGRDQRPKL